MSIKNRIQCGTAVAHISTKYYLAADMARDEEIDLSCVPTAEMIADRCTTPLPKAAFLKQCAAIGMIASGHGNGLGNSLGIGIGNGLGSGTASGMRLESTLIGHVCFDEIQDV